MEFLPYLISLAVWHLTSSPLILLLVCPSSVDEMHLVCIYYC